MAYRVALQLLFLVTVVCCVYQLQNNRYGRQFVILSICDSGRVHLFQWPLLLSGMADLSVFMYRSFCVPYVCLSGLHVAVISLFNP